MGAGQKIAVEQIPLDIALDIQECRDPAFYRVHHEDGRFLGMGEAIAAQPSDSQPSEAQPSEAQPAVLLVPKLVWDIDNL
ncbi:MAG: hypothetical protein HC772_15860 [Leptolyngbyaceae cyanobacterium CRU_2_3]|nr:hypothetical protein [Leptolyngbyaceae cyanobacterium CRU_2_3]